MRENDAWFGHGGLHWWEEGGLTSVHYLLGPWKEDKDFVSSAYDRASDPNCTNKFALSTEAKVASAVRRHGQPTLTRVMPSTQVGGTFPRFPIGARGNLP